MSDTLSETYRTGAPPKPRFNNKNTVNRRRLYQQIQEQTAGDPEAAYEYSRQLLKEAMPVLQQYVISKGETPNSDLDELIKQTYELRCNEIANIANTMGIGENDAALYLEDDEAETEESNPNSTDSFLGMYAAPLGIAATYLESKQPDNFDNLDPSIVTSVLNVAGTKINKSSLLRAAQNKPAGVLGTLSTGGNKVYNTIRAYLQKPENADEKRGILNGTITDVSQLRLYGTGELTNTGTGLPGKELIDEVAKQKKKEMLRKYLPLIIVGIIALILIVYFVARKK